MVFLSLAVIFTGYSHLQTTLPKFGAKNQDVVNPSGEEFKIMSYNVRAFNVYEWLKDPNTNQGIFNFIRSEQPDIICLQEFYTHQKSGTNPLGLRKLFDFAPYQHLEYSYKSQKSTGFGIATFSSFPIVDKGIVEFENSNNIAIYTDILFNKDTLRVINVHFQSVNLKANNYAFLDSLKLRYDEQNMREIQDLSLKLKAAYIRRAGQVRQVADIASRSPHPVIICGDLNDTPVSYAYRKTKGNLKDAWTESGSGFGNTYFGRFSFRIDYIFYSEYFNAIDFERVKTKLSDHYPVMASFLVD